LNTGSFFPWCNFFEGSQRSYLMKEELTAGTHGVEGRYPFLDPAVVQEFLWLRHDLKNAEYKKPVADFLRAAAFPTAWDAKVGFSANHNLRSGKDRGGGAGGGGGGAADALSWVLSGRPQAATTATLGLAQQAACADRSAYLSLLTVHATTADRARVGTYFQKQGLAGFGRQVDLMPVLLASLREHEAVCKSRAHMDRLGALEV
jgi:hypothetical protein